MAKPSPFQPASAGSMRSGSVHANGKTSLFAPPAPAGGRRIDEERLGQCKRQIELVGLLGVDGERQPSLAHRMRELKEPRHEFLLEARLLRWVIAWVQGRKLYREPWATLQLILGPARGLAGPGCDGRDCLAITSRVTFGVVIGTSGFSQHVEGEAIALLPVILGISKRLFDRLSEHELAPENAHGLAQRLADHWLAASCGEAPDEA